MPKTAKDTTPQLESLTDQFSLDALIKSLSADLNALREGKISVRDAQARANLARQILRGVHYVVMARKFMEDGAKPVAQLAGDGAKRDG